LHGSATLGGGGLRQGTCALPASKTLLHRKGSRRMDAETPLAHGIQSAGPRRIAAARVRSGGGAGLVQQKTASAGWRHLGLRCRWQLTWPHKAQASLRCLRPVTSVACRTPAPTWTMQIASWRMSAERTQSKAGTPQSAQCGRKQLRRHCCMRPAAPHGAACIERSRHCSTSRLHSHAPWWYVCASYPPP
jgi:hypothetical protein